MRNIQFILETHGCSLDSAMIIILKSILKNYPDKNKFDKIQNMQSKKASQRSAQLAKFKKPSLVDLPNFSSTMPQSLLKETKLAGKGTSSAHELGQSKGFASQRDREQKIITAQLNQNSARGSSENLRLDGSKNFQSELNKIFRSDRMTIIESIFSLSWITSKDEPFIKKEPNSGFEKTLMNLFNILLETYISVLSSISSHILHQIFYEVIVPCLTNLPFEEDRAKYDSMEREEKSIYFEFSAEVKIFAVKIAEKIITICQGDLIMNKTLLDTLVKASSSQSHKQQLEATSQSEQLRGQMKILWQSIRQKVFTNYSMKGLKSLAEWLAKKLQQLAQSCSILDGKSNASDIAMLEIQEEDLQQLFQYLEIVTCISVGRRCPQEEANSLIKIKQDYCIDLYLFLNPLLFWLDFSIERVERLSLFKQVYQTIKDVLESLPPKKVEIDIFQIVSPFIQRTNIYLKQNAPSQNMLKFMDIVLTDLIAGKYCVNNPELQEIFLDQLNSIINHVPFSLFEEVFPVFDKLLQMSSDVMNQYTLKRCIMALVDVNTSKNFGQGKTKQHKTTMQMFMKALLDANSQALVLIEQLSDSQTQTVEKLPEDDDSNENAQFILKKASFFEIMVEYCFFENDDQAAYVVSQVLSSDEMVDDSLIRKNEHLQFRSPQELHEIHIEKIQFFIETLSLLTERHVPQFLALLKSRRFRRALFGLLDKGETSMRLKCHEILEILGQFLNQFLMQKNIYEIFPSGQAVDTLISRGFQFNPTTQFYERFANNDGRPLLKESQIIDVEVLTSERLILAQLMVECVKRSFEKFDNGQSDSYMQFNSLILLDFLFQHILPVASFPVERLKDKVWKHSRQEHPESQEGSRMEDGSSGGEGTGHTGRRPNFNDRRPNPNYIGKYEEAMDLDQAVALGQSLEVRSNQYQALRMKLVLRLWPQVQEALNSPWSNIRSICYGLICSMIRLDIRSCYQYLPKGASEDEEDKNLIEANQFFLKLRHFVIPMMINLLSSKESESKAGGLNILGSFCGLSFDFTRVKISRSIDFFMRNSEFISYPIWQHVFELQDDWDITIKEASIVLIQLCAPRDAIQYFNKLKNERENQKYVALNNKMSKNMTANGHGSMSHTSSARQHSIYNYQSIGSLNGLIKGTMDNTANGGDSRRIDYKQVDFGYKNKHIPGVNEFGKVDMATFLSNNEDMMNLNVEDEPSKKDKLSLDLNQLRNQPKEEIPTQRSLSLTGSLLQNSRNQLLLNNLQQQNTNLAQAIQGHRFGSQASLNAQQLLSSKSNSQFDFFVDDYSDQQIQEIISIFRNEFKPPNNLWIEKAAESSLFNGPDFYLEIFSKEIQNFNEQQIILQQKQHDEIQAQVQSGSSLKNDMVDVGVVQSSDTDHVGSGLINEKPPVLDNIKPINPNQQESMDKNIQNANAVQQKILQNLGEEIISPERDPKEAENQKLQRQDRRMQIKEEKIDLKLFEQINFDEMNIDIDGDINPQKDQQSPSSEIEGQSYDLRADDENDQKEAIMIENDEIQIISQQTDMPVKIDQQKSQQVFDYEKENQLDLSDQQLQEMQDKYKVGAIGTELQVIESQSNELSSQGQISAQARVRETEIEEVDTPDQQEDDLLNQFEDQFQGRIDTDDLQQAQQDQKAKFGKKRISFSKKQARANNKQKQSKGATGPLKLKVFNSQDKVNNKEDEENLLIQRPNSSDENKASKTQQLNISQIKAINMESMFEDSMANANSMIMHTSADLSSNNNLKKSSNNSLSQAGVVTSVSKSVSYNKSSQPEFSQSLFKVQSMPKKKEKSSKTCTKVTQNETAPLPPTGNMSHRGQKTKKDIMRGLKKLKTNEDYYIMKNISEQMNGKLLQGSGNKQLTIANPLYINNVTNSGSNTTKNKTDKHLDINGQLMGQKCVTYQSNSKGHLGTSLGTLNYQSLKQTSHDSQAWVSKESVGRNLSSGSGKKKKKTSNSPKRQSTNQEIKRLLQSAVGLMNTGEQNNQKLPKSGKYLTTLQLSGGSKTQAKTHRGGVPTSNLMMSGSQLQKPNKQKVEKMKDLNYLIKTMEKFSKKNQGSQLEIGQPQIIDHFKPVGSDPQTPKDQTILNLLENNLMSQSEGAVPGPKAGQNSHSAQFSIQNSGTSNSRKTKKMAGNSINLQNVKHNNKSYPSNQQTNNKQLYEAMKFLSGKNVSSKGSMNLLQFNAILSGDRKSSGSRSHGRSATGNTRGMFDLTPDSNNAHRYQTGLGNKSKSSKSGRSGDSNNRGSYSPRNSKERMIERLNLGKEILQAGNHHEIVIVSSQRDTRSVDSKGRSCSTNKSGRAQRPSKSAQSNKSKQNIKKGKKMSFNLMKDQKIDNNKYLGLNYSQTQKFDLNEMGGKKSSGSTQNKIRQELLLPQARDKSESTSRSKTMKVMNLLQANNFKNQEGKKSGTPGNSTSGSINLRTHKEHKSPRMPMGTNLEEFNSMVTNLGKLPLSNPQSQVSKPILKQMQKPQSARVGK